jgi:secondary thiamine-phosphate synthase enzyme
VERAPTGRVDAARSREAGGAAETLRRALGRQGHRGKVRPDGSLPQASLSTARLPVHGQPWQAPIVPPHIESMFIDTPGRALVEVTERVSAIVTRSSVRTGLVTVFCRHTSASLVITENADAGARGDLARWLARLAPDGDPANRHTAEGPDDSPAHLRSAITRTSESIPILDGALALGTWQGIYLCEHRLRGQRRELVVHVAGE